MNKLFVVGLAAAALLAGCGSSSTSTAAKTDAVVGDSTADSSGNGDALGTGDGAADAAGDTVAKPDWPPMDCDDLMPSHCGLPWPSNLYLQPDAKRKTGYTLRFGPTTLPANAEGVHIDPSSYAALDGYSVGTELLLYWQGLDATGLPSEASIDKSLASDAPIVLLQIDGPGMVQKIPYFVEMDATEPDEAQRMLIVRPAQILKPGTRYIVAVRGLKDLKGKAFAPSPAFAALVSGSTLPSGGGPRQAHFNDIFAILSKETIAKESLLLAWDFVTNSDEALHARVLSIREQGYKAVGDKGPELKITAVTATDPSDTDVAYTVDGTFKVPNFLYNYTSQYQRLKLGADGLPVQDGWVERPFSARIPRSAVAGKPVGLLQYGHGLNGSYDEIGGGYLGHEANQYDFIVFGCLMTGMSQYDVGSILLMLADMGNFVTLSDKLHTGVVESILLQRAMRERFADLPEIKKLGITVDKTRLFYSGNSQGGIFGGTVMALSADVTRGHLGVPGNNYSLLLQRSSDFTEFFEIIKMHYLSSRDRLLLLGTIQLLWDQTDPISWYRHISVEPLPGNTPHQVLMVPAKGDWQVAVVANEIVARSNVGIPIMKNYGKSVYGVTEQAYPYTGSGIVLVDAGNPWPGPGNVPPKDDLGDPHGKPRKMEWIQEQMVHFFKTGEIKDVCGGNGCSPD